MSQPEPTEAYTPEPWCLYEDRFLAAGRSPGQPILADFGSGSYWRKPGTTLSNAKRALACVNACAGMKDPAAELPALRAKVEELNQLLREILGRGLINKALALELSPVRMAELQTLQELAQAAAPKQ